MTDYGLINIFNIPGFSREPLSYLPLNDFFSFRRTSRRCAQITSEYYQREIGLANSVLRSGIPQAYLSSLIELVSSILKLNVAQRNALGRSLKENPIAFLTKRNLLIAPLLGEGVPYPLNSSKLKRRVERESVVEIALLLATTIPDEEKRMGAIGSVVGRTYFSWDYRISNVVLSILNPEKKSEILHWVIVNPTTHWHIASTLISEIPNHLEIYQRALCSLLMRDDAPWDEAVPFAREITDVQTRSRVLYLIATSEQIPSWQEALPIMREIEDDELRFRALYTIAIDKTVPWEIAVEVAHEIQNAKIRSIALSPIVSRSDVPWPDARRLVEGVTHHRGKYLQALFLIATREDAPVEEAKQIAENLLDGGLRQEALDMIDRRSRASPAQG